MRTQKQQQRQKHRDNGKYAKVNPCNRCGKSAGDEYFSDRRTDDLVDDEAICLCEKCHRYMDGLSDEAFLAEIALPDYGHVGRVALA